MLISQSGVSRRFDYENLNTTTRIIYVMEWEDINMKNQWQAVPIQKTATRIKIEERRGETKNDYVFLLIVLCCTL